MCGLSGLRQRQKHGSWAALTTSPLLGERRWVGWPVTKHRRCADAFTEELLLLLHNVTLRQDTHDHQLPSSGHTCLRHFVQVHTPSHFGHERIRS